MVTAAVTTAVLVAGCGDQGTPEAAEPGTGTHTMADGSTMSDSEMEGMDHSDDSDHMDHMERADAESQPAPGSVTHRSAPSEAAGMICSLEVARAVQRTFALPSVPPATDRWADETYSCVYRWADSTLHLSVKDRDDQQAGAADFATLLRRLDGARRIKGLQNLGFPAAETPPTVGQVAFLKDHKTLLVDAGTVATGDLPPGFTRTGAAYGVAAAVIACWTE